MVKLIIQRINFIFSFLQLTMDCLAHHILNRLNLLSSKRALAFANACKPTL
jgi:hypothetical protein